MKKLTAGQSFRIVAITDGASSNFQRQMVFTLASHYASMNQETPEGAENYASCFPTATVISDPPTIEKTDHYLEIDEVVEVDGQQYKIIPAPNRNVYMVRQLPMPTDSVWVKKTTIIGTGIAVYSAWAFITDPSAVTAQYGSITCDKSPEWASRIPARWYGRMGTERQLGPYVANLKGDHRFEEVARIQRERYDRAYRAIVDQYPHTARGKKSMGEITMVDE